MKKFKDLTLRGQKMRIVRDAIEQINDEVVIPKEGRYMRIIRYKKEESYFGSEIFRKGVNFQKAMQKDNVQCEACAKGTLFAACVLNVNKQNMGDGIRNEHLQKKKLATWFSPLELDTIETAFEGQIIVDSTCELRNTTVETKAQKFYRKYKTDKKRLLGILKNILKNGKFKP